jgi:hypothetical protein
VVFNTQNSIIADLFLKTTILLSHGKEKNYEEKSVYSFVGEKPGYCSKCNPRTFYYQPFSLDTLS